MDINSKIKLNNGTEIPVLGFGTYLLRPGLETQSAVKWALQSGYRHIDTAALYQNEQDVGIAIKESGLQRKDVFVTTKLWNADQSNPMQAFNDSLKRLGFKYTDLYLIHWPVTEFRISAWKALEKIYKEGKCRAIGVSNFTIRHLQGLLKETKIIPVVNQVEFSPFLFQKELLKFCSSKKITLQAYSPLTHGKRLNEPQLIEIAHKYSKTPAQILIRWSLQQGAIVLPKSKTKKRIKENADVFDFKISIEDLKALNRLNENFRTSWDPTDFP